MNLPHKQAAIAKAEHPFVILGLTHPFTDYKKGNAFCITDELIVDTRAKAMGGR